MARACFKMGYFNGARSIKTRHVAEPHQGLVLSAAVSYGSVIFSRDIS